MNTPDALIGQPLGNILIQQPLGRGGMARVYKGLDQRLRRAVAIKVIAEDLRTSSSYAQRFEREAQAVANLKHPNIVTIFQFGSQGGLYYLVMEYIDGVDLDAILRNYENNGELMPHVDVTRILQAIGAALDYAHSQGVIHRDVKPSNVMLERDGRPVLTDFGLALRISEGTVGDTFGSPHYISPEQARSSANAVPQSDIYSLGVVAYELLAGVVPFDDPSATALAMQHIMAEVPSPRGFNRDLSEGVEQVLFKVLAKEPKDRYQTCEAFAAALRDALEALRQNPVKASTADLPPLPAGVELPPPRRLSMQSARDKLDQELAFTRARGQALTHSPEVISRGPVVGGSAQAVPRRPGWLTYVLAAGGALVAVAVVGLFLSSFLRAPMPVPTVAVLPTETSPSPATATAIPTTAAPAKAVPTAILTQLPSTAATTAVPIAPAAVPTAIPITAAFTQTPANIANPSPSPGPPSPTTNPTSTLTVTSLPAVQAQTAVPTVLYPDGLLLVFIWDNNAFYVANESGQKILSSSLGFDRVLDNGQFGNHFAGLRWAAYYPYNEPNKCLVLNIQGKSWRLPGSDCPYGYNSQVYAFSSEIFWTPIAGSAAFRVTWQGKEVGRCALGQMRCGLRFPPG